ncbi:MAG: outer membrane beta-barrel protein [Bacteriovoracaceae bacterium]|nr:outer membrane beta-barrel protein [Bacteriovoracaceae bacterium]
MKTLLLLLTLSISTKTLAGYYLEPFMGIQFSNQSTEISSDKSILIADETRFETIGPTVGIRTGYFLFPTIAFGADLKYARTTGEGQGKTSKDTEIERKLSELSLFATATYFDGPFKYWLGAGLYGTYSDSGKYNKNGEQSLIQGVSYKAGVGFFFTLNVTINLDLEFTETKTDSEENEGLYPLDEGTVSNALISIGFKL